MPTSAYRWLALTSNSLPGYHGHHSDNRVRGNGGAVARSVAPIDRDREVLHLRIGAANGKRRHSTVKIQGLIGRDRRRRVTTSSADSAALVTDGPMVAALRLATSRSPPTAAPVVRNGAALRRPLEGLLPRCHFSPLLSLSLISACLSDCMQAGSSREAPQKRRLPSEDASYASETSTTPNGKHRRSDACHQKMPARHGDTRVRRVPRQFSAAFPPDC